VIPTPKELSAIGHPSAMPTVVNPNQAQSDPSSEPNDGIDVETQSIQIESFMTPFYISLYSVSDILDEVELGQVNRELDDRLLRKLYGKYHEMDSIGISTTVLSQTIISLSNRRRLQEGTSELSLSLKKVARIKVLNSQALIPGTMSLDNALSTIFQSDEEKASLISDLKKLNGPFSTLAGVSLEYHGVEMILSSNDTQQEIYRSSAVVEEKERTGQSFKFSDIIDEPMYIGAIAGVVGVAVVIAAFVGWRYQNRRRHFGQRNSAGFEENTDEDYISEVDEKDLSSIGHESAVGNMTYKNPRYHFGKRRSEVFKEDVDVDNASEVYDLSSIGHESAVGNMLRQREEQKSRNTGSFGNVLSTNISERYESKKSAPLKQAIIQKAVKQTKNDIYQQQQANDIPDLTDTTQQVGVEVTYRQSTRGT